MRRPPDFSSRRMKRRGEKKQVALIHYLTLSATISLSVIEYYMWPLVSRYFGCINIIKINRDSTNYDECFIKLLPL